MSKKDWLGRNLITLDSFEKNNLIVYISIKARVFYVQKYVTDPISFESVLKINFSISVSKKAWIFYKESFLLKKDKKASTFHFYISSLFLFLWKSFIIYYFLIHQMATFSFLLLKTAKISFITRTWENATKKR